MSRRNKAPKRKIKPDLIYNSVLVQKLINRIMKDGKIWAARSIVYDALSAIQKKTGNCLEVLDKAKEHGRPLVELRSTRLGGSSISVPVNINSDRSESLFLMWIAQKVKAKGGMKAHQKLTTILMDTFNRQGVIIKKKEDNHKMAEANKAFAQQYRSGW